MSEPLGFYVGDRVTLEDVGVEMPPPPPELVEAWGDGVAAWAVTIGPADEAGGTNP